MFLDKAKTSAAVPARQPTLGNFRETVPDAPAY
jgi:hypothetical protein